MFIDLRVRLSCFILLVLPLLTLYTPRLLAFLPLVLLLFLLDYRKVTLRFSRAYLRLYLAVIGVMILSSFISVHPDISFERLGKMAVYILFVPLVATLPLMVTREQYLFSLKLFSAGLFVAAGILAFEVLSGYLIYTSATGLPSSQIAHITNRSAVFISLSLWLVLYYLAGRDMVRKMILYVLMLALIYMTASLSAFLGLLVGGAVFFLSRWNVNLVRKVMGAVLVLGILFSPLLARGLYQFHDSPVWNYMSTGAPRVRIEIWDVTVERIMQRPILGWGLETSRAMPESGRPSLYKDTFAGDSMHPHNAALQVWLEFGIVGVLLLCYILLRLFRKMRQITPEKQCYALALIAAVGSIMVVSHGMWQSWWLGTLLFIYWMCRTNFLHLPPCQKEPGMIT